MTNPAENVNRLLPDDWHELAPLVDRVLDAPPELRAMILDQVSEGDANRRAALVRLIRDCEQDSPLLNRPAAERFAHLVADDASEVPLTGTLGGRYRIEREIGRGGMARVYLAHDEKHAREVAVKVIRAELAASLGRERFLREIAIAARLRHPNIVPLYDSCDADGVLYFVMPYEEGQSLRERLREGSLSIAESMSVLRDVARALAYAHEHGVVHRDVKPDNVMLSGGATVVTDFGIAKAVSVAQGETSSTALTQMGAGIGTPAYMSPEQAVGDPSMDHRADIYSFGCLAYEVFTGKPPFCDLPTHQIISAHVATVPPLVTALRADVPVAVAELIARCLEKSPAKRPANAKDLLSALDAVTTSSIASSWVKPRQRRRLFRLAGVSMTAVIVAAVYFTSRDAGSSAPITLAVLPFDNIAADTAVEFVAGELAEEVATVLTHVSGIQIKSRSGARRYRNQLVVDLAKAGEKLKAEYLVTGSVRQDAERWIVSADLSRAADAAVIWSESYRLPMNQHAGAAEAIARELVAALRSRFPKTIGAPVQLAAHQKTSNNVAYGFYLRGQAKLTKRGQSVRESADLFRAAIREDTLFAQAHSGLSLALAFFPYFHQTRPSEIHGELVAAARRALELDPTLAQPHIALALAHWFDYEWRSAEAELKTAIRLDGRDVEARIQYARQLTFEGRLTESMQQLRIAREQDPSSAVVMSHISSGYMFENKLDSALIESRRALEDDPLNLTTIGLGALVRLAVDSLKEARELADRAPSAFYPKDYVIAKTGDTATVRRHLREWAAITPQPWMASTRRAYAYLGLGDTANALAALEKATEDREIWHAANGRQSPIYNGIRGSARYQALLRRVGISP